MNRSHLIVAADKQKHLDKLEDLKCDTAIINLEDGVFNKQYALDLLEKNFQNKQLRFKNKKIVVRINPLDETGKQEISVLNKLKPDAIRISKIRSINELQEGLKLIDDDIQIALSLETKEAFNNIIQLKIDPRVTTLYLGILDLLESLHLPQNLLQLNNPTIDYILSKALIDSKIANFDIVGFIFQDYKNIELFTKWCNYLKNIGYNSISCISPSQVDIANNIFTTNFDEIEKAKYIKTIFENNKKQGITGFSDTKYGFIDEPIYKDAMLLLKKLHN